MEDTQNLLNKRKRIAVQLGRFAPYHLGHRMITDKMIEINGIENSMVMIGSSNALNHRTPFTFEQRKEMINMNYPGLQVIALPDVKPELIQFDGSSNKVWLKQIMKIEERLNADFVFYGGSEEDLEVLDILFDTEVVVDRQTEGMELSATKVREAIKANKFELLKQQLGEEVAKIALASIDLNGVPL